MRNLGVGGLLGGASGVDVVAPCAHVLLLLEVIVLGEGRVDQRFETSCLGTH